MQQEHSIIDVSHNGDWSNSILLVIDMQKGLLDTTSSQHVENAMIGELMIR